MEAPVNEDVGVFSTIAVTSYCRKGAPMISIRSQIVQAPVDRLAPLVTLFPNLLTDTPFRLLRWYRATGGSSSTRA